MHKLAVLALLISASVIAQDPTIKIRLDATDAPRRLFHVHLTIPAKPGPMTLLYPQWIPGEHGPTGPIADLVGLKITAAGQSIPWTRDSVNMFAFHVTVPDGVPALDVIFDQIAPPDSAGFSSGASATTELAVLNWNQFILYPQGVPADQLRFQADLKVPNAWRYGTALPIAHESGSEVEFQPSSLTTLIDSPVSTGSHYRTIELGRDGSIVHYVHLAGDSDRALEISPDQLDHYKNLVSETGALFGSRHYRSYHFLFTFSDHVASFGLEHHESSDNRLRERGLIEETSQKYNADLLPHEFVHSWNGKFRRPAGLVTPDYNQPMKGELLWVYEGLTQYLGEILTARTGLLSPDDLRDKLAIVAAQLDREAGRKWRSLEDTAISAQFLYNARDDYSDYRRGVDYYDEGTLIWLEADVLIRQLSKGAKSLNDFCRLFEGGPGGVPALKPYTFDDIVAALNSIQPYDWASFLRTRTQSVQPRAPLDGFERGGWKLVYNSIRSDLWNATEIERKVWDFTYSIGLVVKEDGTVQDVTFGGPAQKAGIVPDDKLVAVNNRQWTALVLRDAVQKTANSAQPIELLLKRGEYYSTHRVEYVGGEKFPHLDRDESKPDLLSKILQPLITKQ
ncbi:MAG TPA: PDZ domain-containing protein [Bryobacteraceae bacterium]|nr:PDZ domain-containing protein [Bryobacteraceae bacterium]